MPVLCDYLFMYNLAFLLHMINFEFCAMWFNLFCLIWKKNLKHWGGVIQHLFLFSTSATSSSVENWPLTTRIRFLMTSSEQSTSKRPPTTTGRRLGFTLDTHWQDLIKLFVEDVAKLMLDCHFLLPSEHRSQCTSADCCGTGRGPGHGQSRIGHKRWSVAAGRWVLLPKCHAQ